MIQKNATLLDATNNSMFRQMKCFAYNTLIKIIKKIQIEEKFYNLLFIESHRDKIWKHLVDSSREIKLSMVPEQVVTFFYSRKFVILNEFLSICDFIPDFNEKEKFQTKKSKEAK